MHAESNNLDVAELVAATKKYGNEIEADWSDEVINDCMKRFDANGDGAIDLDEFKKALAELSNTKPGKKGRKKKERHGKNTGADMMGAINSQVNQAELAARIAAESKG